MGKRKRQDQGWYEDDVATSTTLELSQDEQRLGCQVSCISEDEFSAYSSEPEADWGFTVDDIDQGDFNNNNDNDFFSFTWTQDEALRDLSASQNPDAGGVRVSRARNDDSVCLYFSQ
jgi:hypothetical protein